MTKSPKTIKTVIGWAVVDKKTMKIKPVDVWSFMSSAYYACTPEIEMVIKVNIIPIKNKRYDKTK